MIQGESSFSAVRFRGRTDNYWFGKSCVRGAGQWISYTIVTVVTICIEPASTGTLAA